MKVKDNDGKLRMRLVLDKYSAEIFANDGEQVMTSNILYTIGCTRYNTFIKRKINT
mgnify:CR=1 FL=1